MPDCGIRAKAWAWQKLLGLHNFRLADWRACLEVGANAAWATDRGEPIVQAMLVHLRVERIVIPGAAVLERIGLVTEPKEGSEGKGFWHRVGSVFPHKSGKGFDLVIPAGISVSSRIVCVEPKEEIPAPQAEEQGA